MSKLLGFGLGAGLGLIQELTSILSTQNRLNSALKNLDKLKYDAEETKDKLDKTGDAYNTNILNEMNSSVFNLRGILNNDTLLALQNSKLLGQKATGLLDVQNEIDKYNRNIEEQKITLKAGTDTSFNMGNILLSGMTGMKLEKLFSQDGD